MVDDRGCALRCVAYYVSGHGYGHARRSAAIIAALVKRAKDVEVVVRTSAPAKIFSGAGMERVRVEKPELALDFGAAELDAMSIDVPGTVRGVKGILAAREEIVFREGKVLRDLSAKCVVADIPFVIGDVVEEFRRSAWNLPAIAAGNFTWDWIYQPYAGLAKMLPQITQAYGRFDAYLRYPLSHEVTALKKVVDVPLIVHEPSLSREGAAARIGVGGDKRPRVLMAMRGGMGAEMMLKVARESPDFMFLALTELPAGAPENLRRVTAAIDFTDLMLACDVAVTKLGYGIVADAARCGTRLVWPARENFREDEIFRRQLLKFCRQREISRADLLAGRWRESLLEVMIVAGPSEKVAMNGAEVCADYIAAAMR
jgi:hypothetical protein